MAAMVRNRTGRFWHDAQDLLHRDDGPAAEFDDGRKVWCAHGSVLRANLEAEPLARELLAKGWTHGQLRPEGNGREAWWYSTPPLWAQVSRNAWVTSPGLPVSVDRLVAGQRFGFP